MHSLNLKSVDMKGAEIICIRDQIVRAEPRVGYRKFRVHVGSKVSNSGPWKFIYSIRAKFYKWGSI
ncbi:hypothetical protein HanPI659440_Chr15g0605291 [Helianthus annuus]|nr:hypothetical protein HanPI659440_Chr15g0605291 [Helianthus annuus]